MNQKKDEKYIIWIIVLVLAVLACAAGWSISSSDKSYLESAIKERDGTIEKVINDANSKYDDLLNKSVSNEKSVNDECKWLENNISDEVGSHCYDAITYTFPNGDYKQSPFNNGYRDNYKYPYPRIGNDPNTE